MSVPRLDIVASASFFGQVVEETFTSSGRPLQIGNTDALAVPVPHGEPWLVRVRWTSRGKAVVRRPDGTEAELTPEQPYALQTGPIRLELRMVRRFPLRRSQGISWRGSLAWLATVLAVTVAVETSMTAYRLQCDFYVAMEPTSPVFGRLYQMYCVEGGATASSHVTAEYLARLLREDYDGSEQGGVELERREQPRQAEREYMPAGDDGPLEQLGGAEHQAPERIRGEEERRQAEPVETPQAPEIVAAEAGEVMEQAVADPDPEEPEVAAEAEPEVADEVLDDDELDEDPADVEQGFGLRDWFHEHDERIEALEVELMLRVAQERLRINPDSLEALSILSLYQYLAEDYDAAIETYERYIELAPERSSGYNNKALVYKRLGDYQTEESLYRVALAYEPDNVTTLNNLAVNLAQQGRHDEALAIMERLEILDPGEPYADLHRAKIYAIMGDDARALSYFEQALAGLDRLSTMHHIEFRQDIRLDPAFARLREDSRFHALLVRFYGRDNPLGR